MCSRKKFFIPVKVLSKVFRGIFLALLKKAFYGNKVVLPAELGSFQGLLDALYAKSWVVYCKKPFKSPFYVVQYLNRYSHKTAIYNNRLVSMDENSVAFRYRDYRDNKVKLLKLDAMEFNPFFCLFIGEGEAMPKSRLKSDRDQHFAGKSMFCPQ